ncbi:hypothetical protein CR513_25831, partial [Mucuna pruriens]
MKPLPRTKVTLPKSGGRPIDSSSRPTTYTKEAYHDGTRAKGRLLLIDDKGGVLTLCLQVPRMSGPWSLQSFPHQRAITHYNTMALLDIGAWTFLGHSPWPKDKYRIPNSVVTNNGTQFVSNSIREFYEEL